MPDTADMELSANRPGTANSGPGRPNMKPKGRLLDPSALDEVRSCLGEATLQRDELIEYLHRIQNHFGHLSQCHLHGLAVLMRLPMAEIWEVATFYDHFDCIRDGEAPPPDVTIRVCTSLSCAMAGGEALLASIREQHGSAARIIPAPCIGACDRAPAAALGQQLIGHADEQRICSAISSGRAAADECHSAQLFEAYCEDGGYKMLEAVLSGSITAEKVLEDLGTASLRGLGGAGFPTARKWQIVRGYEGPRMMAVNGDEGEPGTFKDRYYLNRDPHRMLEGMLIAARVVEAESVYIYMRGEYPELIQLLEGEIGKLEESGLSRHVKIHLRRGAGAYICGEESAMIESIEGKRGLPRHRPPYVAERGLFDRPTLVNNIETLFWVRDILEKGADWFNDQGKPGHPGFRSYSVSGRVRNPGVVIAPAGSTAAELIERCGGMAEGHQFKGYLPGGASGGILPASKADLPLDFGGALAEEGCFVGSHAVVILSDQDNMKQVALNLMQFFAHESCGQCTPCRTGTEKAVQLMQSADPDCRLLEEISDTMADASICGLGQAASNPLVSVMRHFPEDMCDD